MRAARRLLIAAIILIGLLVGADRLAVHFAESEAATKIQTARNLPQKPTVDIGGFPFLTQLLSGRFDDITVTSPDLTVSGTSGGQSVRLQNFRVEGKGVTVSGNYTALVADTGTGSALIGYADLSAALPNHLTVTYGGTPGKVKVSGKVDVPVLGAQQVSGTANLSVVGGTFISLNNLSAIDGVDPAMADLVSGVLQPKLQLAGLPSGLRLDSVQAGPDGVAVQVSGANVSLGR